MFQVITDFTSPLLGQYREFLKSNRIQVAGIEFIVDTAGVPYTYDINTNTNYNAAAEDRAGVNAMGCLASYLGGVLNAHRAAA